MPLKNMRYWPQLLELIIALCDFVMRWERKFPSDLPQAVKDLLPLIKPACDALKAYDESHAGGK